MRNLFLLLLCLSLVGCTTVSRTQRLEQRASELADALLKKDTELKFKEDQLKLKDSQLNDKELEIGRLRKKLESFGVFQ